MVRKILSDFNIEQIADSGQCFRMKKIDDNKYYTIAFDRYLEITKADNSDNGKFLEASIPINPVDKMCPFIISLSFLVIIRFLFEPFILANQTVLAIGCIFALDGRWSIVIISPELILLTPSIEDVSK